MLRLVQAGTGSRRALVLLFLVGEEIDDALREALGPGPCIVADAEAAGSEPYAALLAQIASMAGVSAFEAVVLGGYSAGVARVRQLLRDGAVPLGVLAIDGTHANKPPLPWQIELWRNLAARAQTGAALFVATHTQNTYVEHLAQPYLSTLSVLRLVADLPLEDAGPVTAPVEHARPGTAPAHGFWIYSYASKECDGEAHGAQLTVALPMVLERHVRPLLDGLAAEEDEDPPTMPISLGARAVRWARSYLGRTDLERQGPNHSPEIAAWLAPCARRETGVPLHLVTGEWCAAFACAAAEAVRRPGETLPHGYRAAGIEIEQDATEGGTFRSAALARDGWSPAEGDLVILARAGAGWERHVCRFVRWIDRPAGIFETIGGNESNAVRLSRRQLSDPDLRGFVEYPREPG
jgi:hypothetical protein